MAITTIGKYMLADAIIGGSGYTKMTNANAGLAVGDSTTAFAVGQTNMQGAVNVTNRVRKAMDASFPSRGSGGSENVLTLQATFSTGDANFAWNEWGAFNNATDGSGQMFNRVVSSLGTKVSTATWILQVTITFS